MQQIIETIEAQLTAANQREPAEETVNTWAKDLQHRLGAIAPDRLERAFVACREECAERRARGAFGQLALDDVIRQYRKTKARAVEVPTDPHCPHGCERGHSMMTDKEGGYDVQVPCSCLAGQHLRTHLKIYARRHNVDELLRFGWKLKPRPAPISQEVTQWLMARSFETSIQHAMWEHRKDRKMPATDENMDRAAKILSGSIGRG